MRTILAKVVILIARPLAMLGVVSLVESLELLSSDYHQALVL